MSELQHYGIKGMKWGIRKGKSVSFSFDKTSLRKGKTYSDELRDLMGDIGIVAIGAAAVAASGKATAGSMIAKYGSLYVAGELVGVTTNRVRINKERGD